MTVDHSLVSIENLEEIASYLPYFSRKEVPGQWEGGKSNDGVFQMPYVTYDEDVNTFQKLLYDSDFMVAFDWGSWDEGRELTKHRDQIVQADLLTLRMLMTAIVRNDRFCEGAFLSAINDGLVADILQRLQVLLKNGEIENSEQEEDTPTEDHTGTTVKTYTVERTTEEGPYEMECPDMQDAESLFEQVKDHITTVYTRILVNGKEVKAHKSERNMMAASDMMDDD